MTPHRLGRYDLTRILGKGAMGVVYEGRDPNLDRRVAIKTIRVENLSAEEVLNYDARFRTESRSAARLQHPNIVSVYDSDRDGDVAFLVMEYVEGEDLKDHMDQGRRFALADTVRIVLDLLAALDHAHRQGIVHRDIKPANLLMEPGGRVKLTDFGVARFQDSGEATRTQGGMVGTLKYMSPEQVKGHKADQRSDLFSAGVLLYQLLTDVRPFDGDNEFTIIHCILEYEPKPPSAINSGLPASIDQVLAKALAKDREQRFQSADEFASALQSALRSSDDTTVVPPMKAVHQRTESGVSTGSFGFSGFRNSQSATSAATITQELELVYWKDVRDSDDVQELETFLRKFPIGVYADLARRRVRKISGAGGSTGSGRGPSGAGRPEVAHSGADYTQTAPDGRADGNPPSAVEERTPGAPVDRTPAAAIVRTATIGSPPPGGEPLRGHGVVPGPAVAGKPAPWAKVALASAVLLLAVGAVMWSMSGPAAEPAGAAVAPLPALAPIAVPAEAPAAAAVASAASVLPQPSASAVVRGNGPGAGPAGGVALAGPPAQKSATSTNVAPAHQQATSIGGGSGAGASTAGGGSAGSPADRATGRTAGPSPNAVAPVANDLEAQCADRLLLAKEICLKDLCLIPANLNNPVCKQRREWESWRREQDKARLNQPGQ